MEIKSINYWFIVYLALIEGLSLLVLDLIPLRWYTESLAGLLLGFPVGFIPMFSVLLLYKFTGKRFPIRISNGIVSDVPLLLPSLMNGIFILLLFPLQDILPSFNLGLLGAALFGFFSVLLTTMILLTFYNESRVKLKFTLQGRKVKLQRLTHGIILYAGLFEFFILPLMGIFYQKGIPAFANGFLSGLIGGSIAWLLVNYILSKKPIEALF
jgi:hypothetical protein